MITHYDLFAGIGGFSLALEEVFSGETIRHIFCEWESFPTAVLKKHWPKGEYWGDIAELVTHTNGSGRKEPGLLQQRRPSIGWEGKGLTIVTGGFPCQPFSAAGRRKGTADDRYQWPNMFAVIRHTKPQWVIAENVRGLVTWNNGLVLETICTDLESEGYEVQPFIIPAVAVGASHRRDRVWIIADRNTDSIGLPGAPQVNPAEAGEPTLSGATGRHRNPARDDSDPSSERRVDGRHHRGERSVLHDQDRHASQGEPEWQGRLSGSVEADKTDTSNATNPRPQRRSEGSDERLRPESEVPERQNHQYPDWQRNWQEVAFATCDDSVDDGLPRLVDGVSVSRAKWRKDSLKAYGNGIVPEIAMNIMQSIKEAPNHNDRKEKVDG